MEHSPRPSAGVREMGLRDGLQSIRTIMPTATKLEWIFREHPDLLRRAEVGELAAGTIDSWIVWKLTGGERHVTEHRKLLERIDLASGHRRDDVCRAGAEESDLARELGFVRPLRESRVHELGDEALPRRPHDVRYFDEE